MYLSKEFPANVSGVHSYRRVAICCISAVNILTGCEGEMTSPCREVVWGSGGIAPPFLGLSIRCGYRFLLDRIRVTIGEREIVSLSGIEPRPFSQSSAVPNELPDSSVYGGTEVTL
jgi:hypothetical protein